MPDENITAPTTSDYSINPQLSYLGNKTRVELKGSCLELDKITYTHWKIVNIHIVYEIETVRNVIIFEVDMSSSKETDNKKIY